jgi:hypothetical protein
MGNPGCSTACAEVVAETAAGALRYVEGVLLPAVAQEGNHDMALAYTLVLLALNTTGAASFASCSGCAADSALAATHSLSTHNDCVMALDQQISRTSSFSYMGRS